MAQTDLAGLLTGITQAPIDPMAGQSMSQRQLAMGAQAAQGLRQGMGGLFGADTRTTEEKFRGEIGSLDTSSPTYNTELLKVVNRYAPEKAAALRQSMASARDEGIGQINPQFYTAESIQAYNKAYQQTGQKDYSLLKEIDAVASAYKVGQMGDIRAAMKKRSESFSSASSLKGKTDTMRELLDSGLKTGALANVSKKAKSLAQSFFPDTDIEGLKEAEVFDALGSQLALLVRNPASDMGLPGATSNRDLDFLISTVPTLTKSVEGNKLLLEVYDAQYNFKKDVLKEQNRLIKANGGIPPLDLEAKLVEFYTNYSVLPESLKERLKKASENESSPTYDERRLAELLEEEEETGTDTTRRARRQP